jgi:uncharacterized Tic20 family protein
VVVVRVACVASWTQTLRASPYFDSDASNVFNFESLSSLLVLRASYFAITSSCLAIRVLTRSTFVGFVAVFLVLVVVAVFFIRFSSERRQVYPYSAALGMPDSGGNRDTETEDFRRI